MAYRREIEEVIAKVSEIAKGQNRLSGFTIGNTTKIDHHGLYRTPLRETTIMITAGAIVYSEEQAIEIAKIADGKVDYILVDAEKKIPNEQDPSELANIERAVRETVNRSTLWVYKGNDLCVDAVDGLLMQLAKTSVRGIGGKKIAILGAGNIGFKLALRLVERGVHVTITRRNKEALETLTKALNTVKPLYTQAKVVGTTDNQAATKGVDIIIGTSHGTPLVTQEMVKGLTENAIIIDVGKGSLYPEAIEEARVRKIKIYRLDISAALEGLIHHLWAAENSFEKKLGSRKLNEELLVSGGLLGKKGEIIVDNVWQPKAIYGIADGKGDFIRKLSDQEKERLDKLKKVIEESQKL